MRVLSAFLFLLMFLTPAVAAETQPPLPDAAAIEAYLNGISTLKSRFIQTANDGKQASGTFMLSRPGKMRFDYDPPITDFIVADGVFVYYYDGQMKQDRFIPISKSLADFFLRPDLKLSGDLGVSDIKRDKNLLQVTLTQTRDPLAGTLALLFSENPLQLKKWRIIDAQGLVTEVELYETVRDVKFDNELFHYYDPDRKKLFTNK